MHNTIPPRDFRGDYDGFLLLYQVKLLSDTNYMHKPGKTINGIGGTIYVAL